MKLTVSLTDKLKTLQIMVDRPSLLPYNPSQIRGATSLENTILFAKTSEEWMNGYINYALRMLLIQPDCLQFETFEQFLRSFIAWSLQNGTMVVVINFVCDQFFFSFLIETQ